MAQDHSKVAYQVMWNRLISVVEEQAHRVFDLPARGRRFVSARL